MFGLAEDTTTKLHRDFFISPTENCDKMIFECLDSFFRYIPSVVVGRHELVFNPVVGYFVLVLLQALVVQ